MIWLAVALSLAAAAAAPAPLSIPPSLTAEHQDLHHRLETLVLKYGSSLDQVLAHRQALLDERAELEGVEDRLWAAAGVAAAALAAYDEAAWLSSQ